MVHNDTITNGEGEAQMFSDILKTYSMSPADYRVKYTPSYVGTNMHGNWYEHPIHGDEAPLILITKTHVYQTGSHEVEE